MGPMSCTELCLRKRILEMPDTSFPTPFSSSFCVVAIIDVSVVCVVEGGDDDDFSDTLSRVSNGVLFVLFIAVVVVVVVEAVVVVVMAPRLVDVIFSSPLFVSSPLCE